MSVIAEFSLPAEQFALGEVLEVRSGVRIRLETLIPTGDTVIPYVWVETDDAAAIEAALRASPVVDDVDIVDELDGETLVRVAWARDINGLIDSFRAADAVVLEGRGHGDHWSFQVRFPEDAALSTFYRDAVDRGLSLDLDSVHNPVDSTATAGYGLTDGQREVLVLALEQGYFDVPRNVTLVELADQLDISDSAVSQRLRRGLTTLLSRTLVRDAERD